MFYLRVKVRVEEAETAVTVTVLLFPLNFSTSHRSERSDLSIGEEIEEDLSAELDEANTSDKVGRSVEARAWGCLGSCAALGTYTDERNS